MDHLSQFLTRVEAYAKKAGISPSTVCGYATGNKRLYSRLKRRAEQTRNDIQRIEAFMASRPAAGPTTGDS